MINKPKKFIPLIALICTMLAISSAIGEGPGAYTIFFFEYLTVTLAATIFLSRYKLTVSVSFLLFSLVVPIISWIMSYDLILGSGEFRGWLAEWRVSRRLKKLNAEQFRVFNEVFIQDAEHSSEIDHVVVSPTGVFVIETKAYRNVQVDSEGAWRTGYKMHRVSNPIEQNIGHIHALKKTIGEYPYFSIIVLTDSPAPKSCKGVVNIKDLNKSIRDQDKYLLSKAQVKEIVNKLDEIKLNSKEAKKEHLRRIQKKERLAQRVS